MRYEVLTGLAKSQLVELSKLVGQRIGPVVRPGGRAAGLGLLHSVALVVYLMRKNPTQAVAGAVFGVSQSTVSRRWDLLRPVIGDVLAEFVPHPAQVAGTGGGVLVDGTLCPTWDWRAIPGLFSGKHKQAGMNIQLAATCDGKLAGVGAHPVPGARHDAYAFEASGLKAALVGVASTGGDLGYVGVDGIDLVPHKTPPGGELRPDEVAFNKEFSRVRSVVERAVAHFKTWRMLSEEGGRFRAPLVKFESALKAITGLYFFRGL